MTIFLLPTDKADTLTRGFRTLQGTDTITTPARIMDKLVYLGLLSFVAIATAQTVCKLDTDCGAGECCYIQPEFLVASKRRQLVLPQPVHRDTGVCEKYHTKDTPCYPLETANGHCGCEPSTRCQWVPDPTTVAMPTGRRSMVFHPEPGAYKCAVP